MRGRAPSLPLAFVVFAQEVGVRCVVEISDFGDRQEDRV
jgi:hypothetical protein